MRAGVVVLLCLMMATPAFAEAAPKQAPKAAKKAPKAKIKQAAPKQTPPATKTETVTRPNPLNESYAALPLSERVAIQTDLIIVGDYKGRVSGVFDDAAIAAVKAFQKRKGNAETGVLNPKERGQLSSDAKPKQAQRGWRVVDDLVAGVRIMVPSKMMPQVSQISAGSRFSSLTGSPQLHPGRQVR